jgi:hypothetical protein
MAMKSDLIYPAAEQCPCAAGVVTFHPRIELQEGGKTGGEKAFPLDSCSRYLPCKAILKPCSEALNPNNSQGHPLDPVLLPFTRGWIKPGNREKQGQNGRRYHNNSGDCPDIGTRGAGA